MPQLLHRHTRTHISRRPIFVFLWLQGKWEPVRCLRVPARVRVHFVVFVELFVCAPRACVRLYQSACTSAITDAEGYSLCLYSCESCENLI